jgi:hypothetical protein
MVPLNILNSLINMIGILGISLIFGFGTLWLLAGKELLPGLWNKKEKKQRELVERLKSETKGTKTKEEQKVDLDKNK